MTKKQARLKQTTYKSKRKSRRKALVVIGLILSLGLTSAILAHWRGARVAGTTGAMRAAAPLPQPQPALSPSSPSKEYIYAGGRLIATEEPSSRINVALASNGGVTSASSSHDSGLYPASNTINGDRKGSSGWWNDNTQYTYPDWLQVNFNGMKAIDEIDVFTLQDNSQSPSEPTETMTFSLYGITAFDVQYWSGSSWVTVPNGSVTGNNKVWKKLTFSSITTNKIRVMVNNSLLNHSRIVELEAWGLSTSPPQTNVALASNGAVASASSTTSGYSPSGAINGDRKGLNWGQNGYWANSGASFPAWMEVAFNGSKTIHEVDVFVIQDSYTAPSEPTETMTFTQYGLTAYQVQYWTGSAWANVPNASVTGNNRVWKKFIFPDLTTSKIRVWVTGSADGYSRIAELEAWGN
jgi:peptidyl-Asp metalloendopeptidase